jgi:MFS transporter, PHS family, inorganic phosphate transporter
LIFAAIDSRPFNWRVVFAAGSGLLAASYNLNVSSVILPHLAFVYWPEDTSSIRTTQVQITTLVGAFIGSLISGFLADKFGRRKIYEIGLLIMMVSSLGLAEASAGFNDRTMTVFGWIIAWRFFAGFGIGWEWTLSAIITAEYDTHRHFLLFRDLWLIDSLRFAPVSYRARMMATVFAMQSFGQPLAATIGIGSLLGIGGQYNLAHETDLSAAASAVDTIWRLVAGAGVVFALAAIILRILVTESPRFTLAKGDPKTAFRDITRRDSNFNDIELETLPEHTDNHARSRYPISAESAFPSELHREHVRGRDGEEIEPQAHPINSRQHTDINRSRNVVDFDGRSFSFRAMAFYLKAGGWRYVVGTSTCSFLLSFAFGTLGGTDQSVLAQIWSPSLVPSNSTWSSTYSSGENNATTVGAEIYDVLHYNANQSLLTISVGSVLGSIIALYAINYVMRKKGLIASSCVLAIIFVFAGIALVKNTGTNLYDLTIIAYAACYFWYNIGRVP